MKVLVASLRHHLFPLAHRLRREGCDVEAIAWRSRYEAAWDGSLRKAARHSDGTLHAEALSDVLDAANRGEVTVVTDVRRIAERFATAPRLFGPLPTEGLPTQEPLLLGGWFTGEAIEAPHLLIADHGVQAGGLGTQVLGGLTLVRASGWPTAVDAPVAQAAEHLKRAGFRGLFHLEARENPTTGAVELGSLTAGWPWLHTQAFVAELQSLRAALAGEAPVLQKRFTVVLPVTVPPWPSEKTAREPVAGVSIEGLTAQQQGQLYWFDMRVREKRLETAGLDGLLAVATGASDSTPALARARALELAGKLRVPGKQYRPDTGAAVDGVLAALEDRWGFVAW